MPFCAPAAHAGLHGLPTRRFVPDRVVDSVSVRGRGGLGIAPKEDTVNAPALRPAALDDAAVDDLRRLEDRIGTTIVAYEEESPYASLSAEQLAEIQRVESTLGVRLLAYRR